MKKLLAGILIATFLIGAGSFAACATQSDTENNSEQTGSETNKKMTKAEWAQTWTNYFNADNYTFTLNKHQYINDEFEDGSGTIKFDFKNKTAYSALDNSSKMFIKDGIWYNQIKSTENNSYTWSSHSVMEEELHMGYWIVYWSYHDIPLFPIVEETFYEDVLVHMTELYEILTYDKSTNTYTHTYTTNKPSYSAKLDITFDENGVTYSITTHELVNGNLTETNRNSLKFTDINKTVVTIPQEVIDEAKSQTSDS